MNRDSIRFLIRVFASTAIVVVCISLCDDIWFHHSSWVHLRLPFIHHVVALYWLLVLLVCMLAAIPWLPWSRFRFRYSLRTLMLMMTAVALLLGFVVWLIR